MPPRAPAPAAAKTKATAARAAAPPVVDLKTASPTLIVSAAKAAAAAAGASASAAPAVAAATATAAAAPRLQHLADDPRTRLFHVLCDVLPPEMPDILVALVITFTSTANVHTLALAMDAHRHRLRAPTALCYVLHRRAAAGTAARTDASLWIADAGDFTADFHPLPGDTADDEEDEVDTGSESSAWRLPFGAGAERAAPAGAIFSVQLDTTRGVLQREFPVPPLVPAYGNPPPLPAPDDHDGGADDAPAKLVPVRHPVQARLRPLGLALDPVGDRYYVVCGRQPEPEPDSKLHAASVSRAAVARDELERAATHAGPRARRWRAATGRDRDAGGAYVAFATEHPDGRDAQRWGWVRALRPSVDGPRRTHECLASLRRFSGSVHPRARCVLLSTACDASSRFHSTAVGALTAVAGDGHGPERALPPARSNAEAVALAEALHTRRVLRAGGGGHGRGGAVVGARNGVGGVVGGLTEEQRRRLEAADAVVASYGCVDGDNANVVNPLDGAFMPVAAGQGEDAVSASAAAVAAAGVKPTTEPTAKPKPAPAEAKSKTKPKPKRASGFADASADAIAEAHEMGDDPALVRAMARATGQPVPAPRATTSTKPPVRVRDANTAPAADASAAAAPVAGLPRTGVDTAARRVRVGAAAAPARYATFSDPTGCAFALRLNNGAGHGEDSALLFVCDSGRVGPDGRLQTSGRVRSVVHSVFSPPTAGGAGPYSELGYAHTATVAGADGVFDAAAVATAAAPARDDDGVVWGPAAVLSSGASAGAAAATAAGAMAALTLARGVSDGTARQWDAHERAIAASVLDADDDGGRHTDMKAPAAKANVASTSLAVGSVPAPVVPSTAALQFPAPKYVSAVWIGAHRGCGCSGPRNCREPSHALDGEPAADVFLGPDLGGVAFHRRVSGAAALAAGAGSAAYHAAQAVAPAEVYVTDVSQRKVYRLSYDVRAARGLGGAAVARIALLAGSGRRGADGGPGPVASFVEPRGVAVDSRGRVFVCDTGARLLRVIDTTGGAGGGVVVSDVCGAFGSDAVPRPRRLPPPPPLTTADQCTFVAPYGVCVDADDNVYVSDPGAGVVRFVEFHRNAFAASRAVARATKPKARMSAKQRQLAKRAAKLQPPSGNGEDDDTGDEDV